MTSIEEYFASNRSCSALVRAMINESDVKTYKLAQVLGVAEGTIRTKLYRNSFTFDEVMLIADACGFKIDIQPK
jgi:hypothetical protein